METIQKITAFFIYEITPEQRSFIKKFGLGEINPYPIKKVKASVFTGSERAEEILLELHEEIAVKLEFTPDNLRDEFRYFLEMALESGYKEHIETFFATSLWSGFDTMRQKFPQREALSARGDKMLFQVRIKEQTTEDKESFLQLMNYSKYFDIDVENAIHYLMFSGVKVALNIPSFYVGIIPSN